MRGNISADQDSAVPLTTMTLSMILFVKFRPYFTRTLMALILIDNVVEVKITHLL